MGSVTFFGAGAMDANPPNGLTVVPNFPLYRLQQDLFALGNIAGQDLWYQDPGFTPASRFDIVADTLFGGTRAVHVMANVAGTQNALMIRKLDQPRAGGYRVHWSFAIMTGGTAGLGVAIAGTNGTPDNVAFTRDRWFFGTQPTGVIEFWDHNGQIQHLLPAVALDVPHAAVLEVRLDGTLRFMVEDVIDFIGVTDINLTHLEFISDLNGPANPGDAHKVRYSDLVLEALD